MPTKRTRNPGAMTSRMLLFLAARSSARLGGLDDVAPGLLVRVERDEALFLGFLEEVGEGTETIVRLVESRIAALERLLDHRAPDLLLGAALGGQRLERAEHLIKSFLLLVIARAGGRGFLALFRRAPFLVVLAHQVVVLDELVAVGDEPIRARALDGEA